MPVATVPAFRYSPGDGRLYVWTGEPDRTIKVRRIVSGTDPLQTEPTGDTIDAPELRTAQAMMAAVDSWRAAQ